MSSTKTVTIAPVKKTVTVEVSQAKAFEVFTASIDRRWPNEHHIGATPVVKQMMRLLLAMRRGLKTPNGAVGGRVR